MSVIINHKICDQSPACGGIEVCPTGAMYYNEDKKRIEIDNTKCISCGACVKNCPINAIGVARTEEEYNELKQSIDEDPRTPEDLFVDRFGGDIINDDVMIEYADIDKTIANTNNSIIELFNYDSIRCLLKSIPYKEILLNTNYVIYNRCHVEEEDIQKYGVTELPCLLLCKNGKLIKTINGYYEAKDKEKLFQQMK